MSLKNLAQKLVGTAGNDLLMVRRLDIVNALKEVESVPGKLQEAEKIAGDAKQIIGAFKELAEAGEDVAETVTRIKTTLAQAKDDVAQSEAAAIADAQVIRDLKEELDVIKNTPAVEKAVTDTVAAVTDVIADAKPDQDAERHETKVGA